MHNCLIKGEAATDEHLAYYCQPVPVTTRPAPASPHIELLDTPDPAETHLIYIYMYIYTYNNMTVDLVLVERSRARSVNCPRPRVERLPLR